MFLPFEDSKELVYFRVTPSWISILAKASQPILMMRPVISRYRAKP
ncbi:MAG: hypothetical protein BWY09_01586 [Candidatus Hydrogenedentes bacterium ADurb.Bin179]|nr:MAG: hypothetical protein BWY09_01586 [Candidatus Hydrogenedentes bacterium ADurb.Bin179]